MRTEQEIRDSIRPWKEVDRVINFYCPEMSNLIKKAKKFAKENGCKLADVKIYAEGYIDYTDSAGSASAFLRLILEKVPKSTEEIEKEVQDTLIREKCEEELDRRKYEALKARFEGNNES
jgi:hypothetical protein